MEIDCKLSTHIDQNDTKTSQTGGVKSDVNSSSKVVRGYRFYKGAHSIKNYKRKVFPDFKTGIQALRKTHFPESARPNITEPSPSRSPLVWPS